MVLPLTGARSLGKIRGSWNGTGEPIFALIFNSAKLGHVLSLDGRCLHIVRTMDVAG
jgi:hypothetical protein